MTPLALDVTGEGPRVVLVHGSMDRASSFAGVARRLADELAVVRYDRRGYARSRERGGPFTLAANVDDLVEVVGGTPSIVVGHSFGGTIALRTAAARPELVRAVVVYEPPLPWLPLWPSGSAGSSVLADAAEAGPEVAAERFLVRMIGAEVWGRLPEATREQRRAEGDALVGELGDLRRPGVGFSLSDVRVPVVSGYGSRSRPHHRAGAIEVAVATGGEAIEIDGAFHGAHRSHPAEFADLVRRAVVLAG